MRSKVVALCLAAVLGVAGGVVTAFALPSHDTDPLHLEVGLKNLPCEPGRSVVMVGWGKNLTHLASAVARNPGSHYLQPSRSCDTAWHYQPFGAATPRPDPEYVVYLGPYDTGRACGIRMKNKGTFVTTLVDGTTDMVQCVCQVDVADAPVLRQGMTVDVEANIWIRQLQEMLLERHLIDTVTGDYDPATQAAVESEQAKFLPAPSGVVDSATWQFLARDLCR